MGTPRMRHSLSVSALACAAILGCSDDDNAKAGPVPIDAIRAASAAKRDELIAVRRDLHMHPELSGEEVRTAGVVATRLRALGLEVRTRVGGHGVVGVLRGSRPGPVVAYRADMDAMPETEPPGRPYGAANAPAQGAPMPFASEDFALFLREIPGTMFTLGVADRSKGIIGSPHTPDFDADERAIAVGVEAMSAVIWQRLHE